MSDGDLIFSGLVAAKLVQMFRLYRGRAGDPDRGNPATKFALRSLAVFALAMLVLIVVAVGGGLTDTMSLGLAVSAFFAGIVGFVGAVVSAIYLVTRALNDGSTIRLADYQDAPSAVKKSMKGIYRAAGDLRRQEASKRGLIDEKDLQRLVYSAGKQAVVSSELSASVRDLRSSTKPADVEAVRQAEERMTEIRECLKDVEEGLRRTLSSARQVSEEITRPEKDLRREQEQAQAEAAEAERHRQARNRLSRANLSAPEELVMTSSGKRTASLGVVE